MDPEEKAHGRESPGVRADHGACGIVGMHSYRWRRKRSGRKSAGNDETCGQLEVLVLVFMAWVRVRLSVGQP